MADLVYPQICLMSSQMRKLCMQGKKNENIEKKIITRYGAVQIEYNDTVLQCHGGKALVKIKENSFNINLKDKFL